MRLTARLKRSPVWFRFAVLPLGAVLLVSVLAVTADAVAMWGRVHPGVRVGGVAVGWMRPADARARLAAHAQDSLSRPVKLRFEEREWEVTAEKVGASVDATRHIEAAMGVGRRGPAASRLSARLAAWFRPVELPMRTDLDPKATDPLLDDVAEAVLRKPKDAAVKVEGGKARLEPAAVGVEMRREAVEESLRAAFVSSERSVNVAVGFIPVSVADEDAAEALAHAERMASGPVRIEHEDRSWEFSARDVGSWLSFRAVPVPVEAQAAKGSTSSAESPSAEGDVGTGQRMQLEAYVEGEKVARSVGPKVGGVGREPVDASFKVSDGRVTIVPSRDGTGPDMKALAKELTVVLKGDGERVVTLRTRRVEPEITTAKARGMGIKERIATYSTNYDPTNRSRVNNIHTLAKALDGSLVPPGGTFSFNETIGPRTAEKGYQEAAAIVNGKLVPQLGGGICQVGTTFFNTVFFSGLPVVERRNHSFYISSYPKGRDATISWGGPDLKFRNDTEHWVLVKTGFGAGSLTVSLYGTDPGYEVAYTTGDFTDVRPHSVSEVEDDTLDEGKRVVQDPGVDGRKCVVTRTVRKGGTVVRTDTFTSVYKPKEEVVRVGTRKVEAPAEEEGSLSGAR
ncbi:MAG: VanW family protein [Coriobacteriia bacterium]|nr:VanW family protein [Coriobacteriia bacterium]